MNHYSSNSLFSLYLLSRQTSRTLLPPPVYWTVTCSPRVALRNKTPKANSCSSPQAIMRETMWLLKITGKRSSIWGFESLLFGRQEKERGREYKKSWAENKHGPCRHKAEGSAPGLRSQKTSGLAELEGLKNRFTREKPACSWPSQGTCHPLMEHRFGSEIWGLAGPQNSPLATKQQHLPPLHGKKQILTKKPLYIQHCAKHRKYKNE